LVVSGERPAMVWSPVLVPETAVVPVTARVGVEEPESVTPFTEVGVMAPKPIVKAGVGEAIDQVAVTPLLASAVDTEVTVPAFVFVAVKVPALNNNPLPTVNTSTLPVAAVLLPNNEFVAIVAISAIVTLFAP